MIRTQDPDWPQDVSEACVDLLKGLLTKDPKTRLGCGPDGPDEIKNHPWFASCVEWDALLEKKIVPPFKPKLSG